jgi:hypothetical protein
LEPLRGEYVYADHTLDHDYDGLRKDVKNFTNDPFRALRPEQINKNFTTEGEDEANNKKND